MVSCIVILCSTLWISYLFALACDEVVIIGLKWPTLKCKLLITPPLNNFPRVHWTFTMLIVHWTVFRAQELLGEVSSVKLQLLGDFHPEVEDYLINFVISPSMKTVAIDDDYISFNDNDNINSESTLVFNCYNWKTPPAWDSSQSLSIILTIASVIIISIMIIAIISIMILTMDTVDRAQDCWYQTLLKRKMAKLMRKHIGRWWWWWWKCLWWWWWPW